MTLVPFTRRTNFPKLAWLINELNKAGIANEITGESAHAPILSVDESRIDEAWDILDPVDDVEDDDPRYANAQVEYDREECAPDFWF